MHRHLGPFLHAFHLRLQAPSCAATRRTTGLTTYGTTTAGRSAWDTTTTLSRLRAKRFTTPTTAVRACLARCVYVACVGVASVRAESGGLRAEPGGHRVRAEMAAGTAISIACMTWLSHL